MTNFEQAIEVISQAISELLPVEDSQNDEVRANVHSLLNCAEDGYILVQWPESQEFMEEEWFEENPDYNPGLNYYDSGEIIISGDPGYYRVPMEMWEQYHNETYGKDSTGI